MIGAVYSAKKFICKNGPKLGKPDDDPSFGSGHPVCIQNRSNFVPAVLSEKGKVKQKDEKLVDYSPGSHDHGPFLRNYKYCTVPKHGLVLVEYDLVDLIQVLEGGQHPITPHEFRGIDTDNPGGFDICPILSPSHVQHLMFTPKAHLSKQSLGHLTPITAAIYQLAEISAITQSHFNDFNGPVCYSLHEDVKFLSESHERQSKWIGIAEHFALTGRDMRADSTAGEISGLKPIFIKDRQVVPGSVLSDPPLMSTIDPDDLFGYTFLAEPEDSGEHFQAHITQKILNNPELEDPSYANINFILQINRKATEIAGYNELKDQQNYQQDELNDDGEPHWHFRPIMVHQDPLNHGHKNYGKGETSYKPLNCFGWAPLDVIQHTFKTTIPCACQPIEFSVHKHSMPRYPALNVSRRSEAVTRL
jgi:hypothetical protein